MLASAIASYMAPPSRLWTPVRCSASRGRANNNDNNDNNDNNNNK